MIPAAAVKAFLRRELDSHLWMKGLSSSDVDEAINALRPRPQLYPDLRIHQKVGFLLGVAFPKFCFWLDMGSGKTLLTLELLRYWWQCGKLRRAVIFITSDKAFSTWTRQIEEYGIGLPVLALKGSSVERWKALQEFDEGLVLVPYPGAVAMTTKTVVKRKKRRWELDDKLVRQFAKWAQGFVLDESTKAANRDSLTYKLVSRLRKAASVRYALAGRPFGRDPTMLWGQQFLIDDGETLGETLGLFRAAFFTEKDNFWDPRGYAKDYKFKKKMESVLAKMLEHRSITYSADECVDLPEVSPPMREFVQFADEAEAYFDKAVQELRESRGNFRAVDSAFLRMRQISSGFIGVKNDETGERAEIEFAENPKLDRLLELADSVPEDRKMVVFYVYTHSGRKINAELKKLGIENIWLWSGSKYKFDPVTEFIKNKKYRAMVIQAQVGAMSLDGLQKVANYLMFYESPTSPIDRSQAEKRLVRQGQEHPVFMYDLGVFNTADASILEMHKEGNDLHKVLLKDPSRAFT